MCLFTDEDDVPKSRFLCLYLFPFAQRPAINFFVSSIMLCGVLFNCTRRVKFEDLELDAGSAFIPSSQLERNLYFYSLQIFI